MDKLAWLLIFLSLNVLANETFIQKFFDAEEAINKLNANSFNSCLASQSSLKPSQSCLESICVDKSFSLPKMIDKTHYKEYTLDNPKKIKMHQMINEIAINQLKEKVITDQLMLDWLKEKRVTSDESIVIPLKIFEMFGYLNLFSYKMNGETLVVDEEESRLKFPNEATEDFSKKVLIVNNALPILMKASFGDNDPARVKLIYPGEKLKQKIQEIYEDVQKSYNKFSTSKEYKVLIESGMMKSIYDPSRFEEILTLEELSPLDFNYMDQALMLTSLLKATLEPTPLRESLKGKSIDLNQLAQKYELISRTKSKLDVIKKAVNEKVKNKLYVSDTCLTAYNRIEEFAPTEKEIKKYKEIEKPLIENYINKLTTFISKESANELRNYSKNWIGEYPPSKEKYFNDLLASLENARAESLKHKKLREKILASKDQDRFWSMYVASFLTDDKQSEELSTDVYYACDEFVINPIPDAAHKTNKNFIVGPIPLKFPKKGEFIFHHELSHLAYEFFDKTKSRASVSSKNLFSKSLSCLDTNHKGTSPDIDVEMYRSEDWADMIASKTSSPDGNLGCFFIGKNIGRIASLENSDETDTHSNYVFRMLHEEYIRKGSIPEICQLELSMSDQKASFQDCFQSN